MFWAVRRRRRPALRNNGAFFAAEIAVVQAVNLKQHLLVRCDIYGLFGSRIRLLSLPASKSNHMEFHRELDARGLHCPLPILKTKKALADMLSGEVLRVMATDTGSVRDFQAFAKQTGNALLEQTEENREFVFFMKRK
jgi:tRNA 2-thiouridine synthesizing protein A